MEYLLLCPRLCTQPYELPKFCLAIQYTFKRTPAEMSGYGPDTYSSLFMNVYALSASYKLTGNVHVLVFEN